MQIDHLDSKVQCKFEGCSCSVAAGDEYCSEHCRMAASRESTRKEDCSVCVCGHADCQTNQPSAAV